MKGNIPLAQKKRRLRQILRECGRVAIAFSGGKDSFMLLKSAVALLGKEQVAAFFVATPFTAPATRGRVAFLSARLSIPVRELELDLLKIRPLAGNAPSRCYHCKLAMFTLLRRESTRLGIRCLCDGTTLSDDRQHRPGRRALQELKIRSPLREAGFTSEEIVRHLRGSGIGGGLLHSTTCLATRFPYGHRLQPREIAPIAAVESFLTGQGIAPVRVRHMEMGIRIEVPPSLFRKLLSLRPELLRLCHFLALPFVTLDLKGFRSGSWDAIGATPMD